MPKPKRDFKHLRRLDRVTIEAPIYFVTSCVAGRHPLLTTHGSAQVLHDQFVEAPRRYGWLVGRYVVMPDHIHVFCTPGGEREPVPLSKFVGGFKMGSSRAILAQTSRPPPLWQREFFDHLLRSSESYAAKWEYVRENPVRAGLVARSEDWPFSGEIASLGFV